MKRVVVLIGNLEIWGVGRSIGEKCGVDLPSMPVVLISLLCLWFLTSLPSLPRPHHHHHHYRRPPRRIPSTSLPSPPPPTHTHHDGSHYPHPPPLPPPRQYFVEAGAIAVRRVKKEDLKRIAKATGGSIVVTLADMEGG